MLTDFETKILLCLTDDWKHLKEIRQLVNPGSTDKLGGFGIMINLNILQQKGYVERKDGGYYRIKKQYQTICCDVIPEKELYDSPISGYGNIFEDEPNKKG